MSKQKRKIVKVNKKSKDLNTRFPLVEVTWKDIVSDSSWQSAENLANAELATCVTKGHLLSQSKGVTRLFGDYVSNKDGELDELGNTTIIPTSVIISVKKIGS